MSSQDQRGMRFLAGHRYVRLEGFGAPHSSCFRIKLPPGGLPELAASLLSLPDVLKSKPLDGGRVGVAYELLGDGFLATLLKEPRARRSAALMVERTSEWSPRPDGSPPRLADYLKGGVFGREPIPEEVSLSTAGQGEPDEEEIAVGPIRVVRVREEFFVFLDAPEGPGTVTLTADQTAEIYDLLGTFGRRAMNYAEALEERLTKPEEEWRQIPPERHAYRHSFHRCGALTLSQKHDTVYIEAAEAHAGAGPRKVGVDGHRVLDLADPLLDMAVRGMKAAEKAGLS